MKRKGRAIREGESEKGREEQKRKGKGKGERKGKGEKKIKLCQKKLNFFCRTAVRSGNY